MCYHIISKNISPEVLQGIQNFIEMRFCVLVADIY